MDHFYLWRILFQFLKFKDKLSFVVSCKSFQENLFIEDIDIRRQQIPDILDEISKHNIFKNVSIISVSRQCFNIDFLRNLKNLKKISSDVFLQKDILASVGLHNLYELNITHTYWLTDVSYLTTLKKLNITSTAVTQNGIRNLDLIKLNVDDCRQITDVSFMTNLKKLSAKQWCGIDQFGIRGLNLIKLDVSYNNKIIDVSSMTNLKTLIALSNEVIVQNSFRYLNLVELGIDYNSQITDISTMTNLKVLRANHASPSQNSIANLDLYVYYAANNIGVIDVSHMKKLKILNASGPFCWIDQKGIRGLDLFEIDLSYNDKIIDLSFMTNLKKLTISTQCKLSLDKIKQNCIITVKC